MRSPLGIVSLLVWALLSLAAGGLAVETLMNKDNDTFTAMFWETEQEPLNSTAANVDVRTQPSIEEVRSTRQYQMLEERLTALIRSLNEVKRENAALVRQQSKNAERLAKMEDTFQSITASITPVGPTAPQQILDGGLPLPTLKPKTSSSEIETAQPQALLQSHVPFPITLKEDVFDDVEAIEATPDLMTSSTATPTTSSIMQTDFAVSLDHYTDIEVLMQSWFDLRESHYETLKDLEPRIQLENKSGNGLELALIAGPLRNAGDAALLCVELGLAGKGCKPVVYSGEAIPLRTMIEIPQ